MSLCTIFFLFLSTFWFFVSFVPLTFTVDAKTEFWGPKGGDRGTGPKGLADDCMAKGYDIKVVPAKDPTVAKDVYLPNRKSK